MRGRGADRLRAAALSALGSGPSSLVEPFSCSEAFGRTAGASLGGAGRLSLRAGRTAESPIASPSADSDRAGGGAVAIMSGGLADDSELMTASAAVLSPRLAFAGGGLGAGGSASNCSGMAGLGRRACSSLRGVGTAPGVCALEGRIGFCQTGDSCVENGRLSPRLRNRSSAPALGSRFGRGGDVSSSLRIRPNRRPTTPGFWLVPASAVAAAKGSASPAAAENRARKPKRSRNRRGTGIESSRGSGSAWGSGDSPVNCAAGGFETRTWGS